MRSADKLLIEGGKWVGSRIKKQSPHHLFVSEGECESKGGSGGWDAEGQEARGAEGETVIRRSNEREGGRQGIKH